MPGSEVWGAYDKNENTTWKRDTIEKAHINFCKVFLGVNKRPPNATQEMSQAGYHLSYKSHKI